MKDEEYQRAVSCGICKINYYSTMAYDAAMYVKERLNNEKNKVFISDVALWYQDYIRQEVQQKIRVFGSNGKA